MKKKIIVILVCTLLMVVSFSVAVQTVDAKQHSERSPIQKTNENFVAEPLPIKKVWEVPVPWLNWRSSNRGVIGELVIHEEAQDDVKVGVHFVALEEALPLEDLTLADTKDFDWEPMEFPNDNILNRSETYEFSIPVGPDDGAVLVRCSAAFAETPDVIEAHFINEAILENRGIVEALDNFHVHNSYREKPINNFELELHGDITPDDVLDIYDRPNGTVKLWDPEVNGSCWWNGWGVPDMQINSKPYGLEFVWIDKDNPVGYCEWIHFGVTLDPRAYVYYGARAHLTIWTRAKDRTVDLEKTMPRNKQYFNTPFLNFLQNHPNMFSILRHLLGQ